MIRGWPSLPDFNAFGASTEARLDRERQPRPPRTCQPSVIPQGLGQSRCPQERAPAKQVYLDLGEDDQTGFEEAAAWNGVHGARRPWRNVRQDVDRATTHAGILEVMKLP
jgi:hypothetical protein